MAAERDGFPGDLVSPFLFVPHGDPDPVEWKKAHPGWVSFPAVMVPRADPARPAPNAGQGQTQGPRNEWGHRSIPPLDEYGPGELAAGERAEEVPEPDPMSFHAMMAAMEDPVGTLRVLGCDIVAPVVDARYIPNDRTQPPNPNADRGLSPAGVEFLYRHEAEPGSEHTHWPGGSSGVTLGPGYDMRYRTQQSVKGDLLSVGVDAKIAQTLAAGAGLHGTQAEIFAQMQADTVTLTEAQELFLMLRAMQEPIQAVREAVHVPLNDNEFAALVSFVYNVGVPQFRRSDLLRRLNAGDRAGAIAEFPLWNISGGAVDRGLTNRRADEVALFEAWPVSSRVVPPR